MQQTETPASAPSSISQMASAPTFIPSRDSILFFPNRKNKAACPRKFPLIKFGRVVQLKPEGATAPQLPLRAYVTAALEPFGRLMISATCSYHPTTCQGMRVADGAISPAFSSAVHPKDLKRTGAIFLWKDKGSGCS